MKRKTVVIILLLFIIIIYPYSEIGINIGIIGKITDEVNLLSREGNAVIITSLILNTTIQRDINNNIIFDSVETIKKWTILI